MNEYNSRVSNIFLDIQETMKLKFRGWENDIPHSGEKGGIRERRVADFLASILPKKYGIGTGHIIDSQANPVISHQTDIIIYDSLDGIALPVDDYYSLYPCECVYATIEVKSKLNASDGGKESSTPQGEIYDCLVKTERLKHLNRDKYSLQPIHSIVFAYETDWKKEPAYQVKKWFEYFGEKYSLRLPESVMILEPSMVLGTYGPTGYNDSGVFSHIYEKDPLLYFISDLLHRLSQTKTAVPHLWNDYAHWRYGDIRAKIYMDQDISGRGDG